MTPARHGTGRKFIRHAAFSARAWAAIRILACRSGAFQNTNGAENGQALPLLGLAHVGIQVSDLEKSRAFYHGVLGFEEAFDAKESDGSVAVAFYKVNDDQFIELSPGLSVQQLAPMTHIALLTGDIEKLRQMLEKRGVKVGPIHKGPHDGNLICDLRELPGQNLPLLEFVQYLPDSPRSKDMG